MIEGKTLNYREIPLKIIRQILAEMRLCKSVGPDFSPKSPMVSRKSRKAVYYGNQIEKTRNPNQNIKSKQIRSQESFPISVQTGFIIQKVPVLMLDYPFFGLLRYRRMNKNPNSGKTNSASRLDPLGLKNPDTLHKGHVFYLLKHFFQLNFIPQNFPI